MKKFFVASLVVLFACGIVIASDTPMLSSTSVQNVSSSSSVNFPTGVFFNGTDFVKVESSWVRIYINCQSSEYDIKHAEIDPSGNFALVLDNGASITIYSNGRSLYYDGSTYAKK